jgi:hypothetical protein
MRVAPAPLTSEPSSSLFMFGLGHMDFLPTFQHFLPSPSILSRNVGIYNSNSGVPNRFRTSSAMSQSQSMSLTSSYGVKIPIYMFKLNLKLKRAQLTTMKGGSDADESRGHEMGEVM